MLTVRCLCLCAYACLCVQYGGGCGGGVLVLVLWMMPFTQASTSASFEAFKHHESAVRAVIQKERPEGGKMHLAVKAQQQLQHIRQALMEMTPTLTPGAGEGT